MFASLSPFGANSYAVWEFAVGVLGVLFVVALILMGVGFIKSLINQ